jgi:hypothetical protein
MGPYLAFLSLVHPPGRGCAIGRTSSPPAGRTRSRKPTCCQIFLPISSSICSATPGPRRRRTSFACPSSTTTDRIVVAPHARGGSLRTPRLRCVRSAPPFACAFRQPRRNRTPLFMGSLFRQGNGWGPAEPPERGGALRNTPGRVCSPLLRASPNTSH